MDIDWYLLTAKFINDSNFQMPKVGRTRKRFDCEQCSV